MKLLKINHSTVSDSRTVPGLIQYQVDYKVTEFEGKLEYLGPKFPPAMWHQLVSFFQWTYQTMQSESQVRLYVNLKLGKWGAWAFPQAARTGMTARELPVPETEEQARKRFASWGSEPSDDWLYFGTAHHHCSTSAFQSSTDEANERDQDGLHITVGRMDAERYDLHARFYLGGNCFEPDLSAFWAIDPVLAEQVPASMQDALARFQMCQRITVEFPDAWRKNLVESKGESRLAITHWDHDEIHMPVKGRVDKALDDIAYEFALMRVEDQEWLSELGQLSTNEISQVIFSACCKYEVAPEDVLRLAKSSQADDLFDRSGW